MEIDELTAGLRQTTSFDSMGGLYRPLLRLLADGRPVSVEDLAAAAGRSVDDVRQTVASLPDVEIDDQGLIVGYGLTLRETPHRFEIDGKRLYTWCALDTLVFPEAAQGWLGEHPGMTVHSVAEAFRLGQPLVEALLEPRPADPDRRYQPQLPTMHRAANAADQQPPSVVRESRR